MSGELETKNKRCCDGGCSVCAACLPAGIQVARLARVQNAVFVADFFGDKNNCCTVCTYVLTYITVSQDDLEDVNANLQFPAISDCRIRRTLHNMMFDNFLLNNTCTLQICIIVIVCIFF